MSSIQVGSTVKVVSGGRYLGKEGIVKHVYEDNGSVRIEGHFPRSKNKTEQGFQIEHLKVIENTNTSKADSAIRDVNDNMADKIVKVENDANLHVDKKPDGYCDSCSSPIFDAEFCPGDPCEKCSGPHHQNDHLKAKPQGGQHTHSTPLPTKADDAERAEGEQGSDPMPGGSTAASAAVQSPPVSTATVPSLNGSSTDFGVKVEQPVVREGVFANKLASKFAPSTDTSPHLIVRARAGTGKTTTLVHGVRRVLGLLSDLIPSPQQQAVWDSMELSKGKVKTIGFCAFNKSIATELQARLPHGCEAATLHSLGFKAVKAAFGRVVSVNQYRTSNLIAEITGRDIYDLRREQPVMLRLIEKLVSLCKMNLTDPTPDNLLSLISHHDIDTDGVRDMNQVFSTVVCVLEAAKDVRKDNAIDYDDMIWIPVVLGLPVVSYDLLLVDEAQDLNRCQQALAKSYGKRLILCGDDRQAIYGFAGADCDSLPRMGRELGETDRGCEVLPLTVTRRCGKAIVREAQKIVPDFEAFESNPEGVIASAQYPSKTVKVEDSFMSRTRDGDMVLCRCNAPLVSTCFKFLRIGRKAQIQGRDIGQGLISTIKKLKASSVVDLQKRLSLWLHQETSKENAKRNPSEDKLIAIQDRYDCLCMFMEGATEVDQVIRKIESVFTDNKDNPGVKLSSIHKAKGLEADRVFLLQLKKASVPHPMAKTEWAREQEMNLKYVAVTRAIHELVIVTGGDDERRDRDEE